MMKLYNNYTSLGGKVVTCIRHTADCQGFHFSHVIPTLIVMSCKTIGYNKKYGT